MGSPTRRGRSGSSLVSEAKDEVVTHGGQLLDAAGRRSRRAALGVIIFLSTLPLQWQVLASTPVGQVRYFHLGALMMIALAKPEITQVRALLRSSCNVITNPIG